MESIFPGPRSFSGQVHAVWDDDGRHMILTKDLIYIDGQLCVWKAEVGDCVDGASIPRFFWRFIGSPFCGKFRRASVIHDVYCVNQQRSWERVHRVFAEMMQVDQVEWWRRKLMGWAVWHFGPRWTTREQHNQHA